RPGRVFSQREIYEFAAPDSFDSSWTGISSIIYKLRHKLNADFIQTVYGKGYKFLPP
ncbi:helix-turn-helix domain-containing protein, partial [Flavonifractor plautii]